MHVFYCPDITGEQIDLPDEEARHAGQVLRLVEGDSIKIVDGQGKRYTGSITSINKKKCRVRLVDEEVLPRERSYRTHLVFAPTKNSARTEWLLEKATEIGVDEITPVFSFHSERRRLRTDRMERILLAAMKQSQRAWLPRLNTPLTFAAFLEQDFGESQCLLAYIDDLVTDHLQDTYHPQSDVVIGIGPEGGFSAAEAETARAKGFTAVSLGPYRLRTETAGIVALQTIHLINLAPD